MRGIDHQLIVHTDVILSDANIYIYILGHILHSCVCVHIAICPY